MRLLATLTGLNVLSFVDRQLVVALAPLLIADLGFSRAQIGLLLGVAFIPVYSAGLLAVGLLADRASRTRIVAAGLAAWSAATALTGAASGFAPFAASRAIVGIGEATLPATALSMIGDVVRPTRIGFANGVFYSGIPVGYALSFVVAGAVGPTLGWRACFLALGALGLVAAGLIWRVADVPRREADSRSARGLAATLRELARAFASQGSLLLVIPAATLLVFASASAQHVITWLVEERGFAFPRAAFLSAAIVLTAGLVGNLGIGALSDLARRRHPGARLVALAAMGALGIGAALVFYRVAPDSGLFLPAWFLAQAWLFGWYGPLVAAVGEMAPPGLRASVIGVALLAVNLLGVTSGPFVTGLIGDRASLTTGLTWSLVPAAAGLALLGAVGLGQLRRPSEPLSR